MLRPLNSTYSPALLLASGALASSLLALLRDRLLAGVFGASRELDIYYAAFRIPDMLFTLFLLFVASTAFIPVFLKQYAENREEAKKLLDALFTVFLIFSVAITVIVFFLMPYLMPLVVPGFDIASQEKAVILASILLFSPIFLGISNLVSGVIQSFKKFFIYALSPVFYNIGIIIGITVFVPLWGLTGLALGVVLGAFLHFLIQVPVLFVTGYFPVFGSIFAHGVKNIIKLSFPRTLALSMRELTFFAVTAIASTLSAGSIAVFNLSYNLQSLPLAIVGLSYSIAAFPVLSEFAIKKNHALFFQSLEVAFKRIIFWTVPASVLFIVLRAQIVRSILGTGAFGWVDTRLTAATLLLFSIGIVGQSLVVLFVRSFYALGKTREPILYSVLGSLITIILSTLFVYYMKISSSFALFFATLLRVGDIENVVLLALPLAYSVGVTASALFLARSLWVLAPPGSGGLMRSILEIVFASAVMGFTAYFLLRVLSYIFNLETFLGIFSQGVLSGLGGIVLGLLLLYAIGNRELREMIGREN